VKELPRQPQRLLRGGVTPVNEMN